MCCRIEMRNLDIISIYIYMDSLAILILFVSSQEDHKVKNSVVIVPEINRVMKASGNTCVLF